MNLLEKLLIGGGAALLASTLRDTQETKRRRNSPLRFDDRCSQSDFAVLATEIAARTPRVIGASTDGTTVVLHVRSITGLSDWYAEVDFNDYGHLTGTYWINSDNDDSQIPAHFADALSEQVAARTATRVRSRESQTQAASDGQHRDSGSARATQTAPPGWYPTAAGHRFWNGSAWTNAVAPATSWPADSDLTPQFSGQSTTSPGGVVFAWIIATLTVGYMLPWAVAMSRGTRNRRRVCLVNFFLGWTIIGWIAAMVMACVG